MYMHEKIPWERIVRTMATPKLLMSRDYHPRFYLPTSPFVCKLLIMNDLMWGR